MNQLIGRPMSASAMVGSVAAGATLTQEARGPNVRRGALPALI